MRKTRGLGSERVAAFERLGLPLDADADAIKKAYRRATLAHPPDIDPDAFREVRAAYERLENPWKDARERLRSVECFAEPPALKQIEPVVRHALALSLLRDATRRVDARSLLPSEPRERGEKT